MEWFLIIAVALIVLVLLSLLVNKDKQNQQPPKEEEPVIVPIYEVTESGTVIDIKGLEKYGYGDLAYCAPLEPPYSFFFFIVRYKARNGNTRYSIAVSRGFEEPRIIKYCTYDEFKDITKERIEYFVKKFDIFVDDVEFNNLVCNYREDCIIEIIKKL